MTLWAKIAIGAVGAFVTIGVIAVATGPAMPAPTASAPSATPAGVPPNDPAIHAAVADATYLNTLKNLGVPVADTNGAIALGHSVCSDLDGGQGVVDIAGVITASSQTAGHVLTSTQAGGLIGDAVSAYCPGHMSAVSGG